MNQQLIQFGTLEAFTAEAFEQGALIRVVVLDVSESVSSQIPDLRMVRIGVHVRSINKDGHILACHLPVAQMQLYNGRRDGDPLWQKYDAAWEKAVGLKERVVTFLETNASNNEVSVRTAGVIDIGKVRPLHATWKPDPILLTEGTQDELVK